MVSNVNSISQARFQVIHKPPDEEPLNESYVIIPDIPNISDRLEISNEAFTASINSQIITVKQPTREFMEVFSVNFWSLGLEEQKQ